MAYPFFAGPEFDETLFGMCARSHVLGAGGRARDTVAALFGTSGGTILGQIGARAAPLFERVGHLHWQSLDELLNGHTLMPLCRAMLEPSDYQTALGAARATGAEFNSGRIGFHQLRRGSSMSLRMCPLCVADDADSLPPLWRVTHQIPWVTHCWRHATPLVWRCERCGCALAGQQQLQLPGTHCTACGAQIAFSLEIDEFECHVACFYTGAWVNRVQPLSGAQRGAAIRARARDLGFDTLIDASQALVGETGVRAVRFQNRTAAAIEKTFGRSPLRLHTSVGSRFFTRMEVLLVPWLFNDWEHFAQTACAAPGSNPCGETDMLGSLKTPGRARGAKLQSVIEAFSRTPNFAEVARQYHVSQSYVKYASHKAGKVSPDPRAKPANPELIKAICDLSSRGMERRSIAEQVGVLSLSLVSDIVSIYLDEIEEARRQSRVENNLAMAKERLQALVEAGTALSRSQLRELSGSAYATAKKLDPNWIEQLILQAAPIRESTVTSALEDADRILLEALCSLERRWDREPPNFVMSVRAIRRLLGEEGRLLKRLPDLKMSQAKIAAMTETLTESANRRIMAAIERLPEGATGRQITVSAKMRSALGWATLRAVRLRSDPKTD